MASKVGYVKVNKFVNIFHRHIKGLEYPNVLIMFPMYVLIITSIYTIGYIKGKKDLDKMVHDVLKSEFIISEESKCLMEKKEIGMIQTR